MTRALTAGLYVAVVWFALRFFVPQEAVRALNVALSVVAAAGMLLRLNDTWDVRTRGFRVTMAGVVGLLAVVAYGSSEAYAAALPTGERTPLVSLACLTVLVGLWISRHDHPRAGSH